MIRNFILLALLISPTAWGEEIIFLNKGLPIESQLIFFWRKIPLNQIDQEGNVVHVKGRIDLSLHRLPGRVRADLKQRLEKVLNGEEAVGGVTLETSSAEIFFSEEGLFVKGQRLIVESDPPSVVDVVVDRPDLECLAALQEYHTVR